MSTTKLTLSIDKGTIEVAKRMAAESNMSVSKLFKKWVMTAESEKSKNDPILDKIRNTEIPDWIKQLTVVDKPTPDFDHKAEYGKHIEEKFGA